MKTIKQLLELAQLLIAMAILMFAALITLMGGCGEGETADFMFFGGIIILILDGCWVSTLLNDHPKENK